MKDVEKELIKNICIFCLKYECEKNCMKLVQEKQGTTKVYKCLNFVKKHRVPQEFAEFVRYTFYEEDGSYIAIVKRDTPKYVIHQMKYKFDEVKFKE